MGCLGLVAAEAVQVDVREVTELGSGAVAVDAVQPLVDACSMRCMGLYNGQFIVRVHGPKILSSVTTGTTRGLRYQERDAAAARNWIGRPSRHFSASSSFRQDEIQRT